MRVPEDGEIVHGDDERNGRADRAAIGRAVQDVVTPRRRAEDERIPERIARKIPQARAPPEREWMHVHVLPALELPHESVDVAGRSGTRLRERRDVDTDGEHHRASA